LIMSTPQCNLGEAMKYLHREVARQANHASGRVNHFFGGRYKWSLISHENYFWNCVKYVYRNPVRAKICNDVRSYKFSSLNSKAEQFDWKITDFFQDEEQPIELDINWLNQPPPAEVDQGIRNGLRRRVFELSRKKDGYVVNLDAMPSKKGTVT